MQLVVNDLNKSFNGTQVLKDINLTVNSGQIYGYVGRNGAGKTTSMRILMDVFEGDSGSITLDGEKFNPVDHLIGYLPEERGMYAKVKVKEQLLYFAELRGAQRKEAEKSVYRWSKEFEIEQYLDQNLDTLSKGNQQKVQITQAFISEPDILILDEPFSGLDPVNSKIFQDALLDYIREDRIIIFSSHQMSYVESFCDNIAIIKAGQIVLEGNLKEIKKEMGEDRLRVRFGEADMNQLAFLAEYDYMLKDEDIILNLKADQSKEDFIREVLDQKVEINRFMDYLPSLQEIFIEKAGNQDEEI